MSDPIEPTYDHDEAHQLGDRLMQALTPASKGMTMGTVLYAVVMLQASLQRLNAESGMTPAQMRQIVGNATACGLQGFFQDHDLARVVESMRSQKAAAVAGDAVARAVADVVGGWSPPSKDN